MVRKLGWGLLLLLGLLVGGSVLGGSAVWFFFGEADALNVEGEAPVIADVPSGLGDYWHHYGGDPKGHRFVSADQITAANVGQLEPAWTFAHGEREGRDRAARYSAFGTTPILAEGSLIFCTPFNQVIAIDPGTGAEKWRYDSGLDTDAHEAYIYQCRGVVYWRDSEAEVGDACTHRVFMGTLDTRVIALDARTGLPCSDFGSNGEVQIEPDIAARWPGEFQITSAPEVVSDVVITGTAISDNDRTEAPKGTVYAFDARTGAARWTFDPLRAEGSDAGVGVAGHANVWTGLSSDPERGLVFLPTSSPSPDYFGGNRPGDNRHANSVVAIEAATGAVKWAFQIVHHDVLDYDVSQAPGIYPVTENGRTRDVVMQLTKQGLLFQLDPETGVPVKPVEERPVPQGGEMGEKLSPTQPFPVETPPLVPSRLDPDDAFGITLWDKNWCADRLRRLRSEGLYTPPSLQGTLSYPFTGGGANWGGSAYDPRRNIVIVNMSNVAEFVQLHDKSKGPFQESDFPDGVEYADMEGAPYGLTRGVVLSPLGLPCSAPPWGLLMAVDLASGKIVWRKVFGTTEDLAPGGLALKTGTPTLGGPIVTAGDLVFIGGSMDDYIRAFDVSTGTELWKGRLPGGGQSTPISYMWKGKQYVVIAAGGHSRSATTPGDEIIAFALPD